MEWLLTILTLTNAWTLFLYFRKKPKLSKEVVALQKVVAAFEVEGQTILSIQKISPDSVYLRSAGRPH